MFGWLASLVVLLGIVTILGFTGAMIGLPWIGQVLLIVFLLLFVVAVLAGAIRRRPERPAGTPAGKTVRSAPTKTTVLILAGGGVVALTLAAIGCDDRVTRLQPRVEIEAAAPLDQGDEPLTYQPSDRPPEAGEPMSRAEPETAALLARGAP